MRWMSDDFKLGGLAGGAEAVTLRLGLPEDFASAALTAALVSFLRRMSLQCTMAGDRATHSTSASRRVGSNGRGRDDHGQ